MLVIFALAVIAFGVLVELRAVYQSTSKTDFGVYARAAWAVRTGQDPYAYHVHDNNGWHYCYPLPFAVVLAPLADPLPWESHDGYLPFEVSVALWYILGVACLAIASHLFAKAVLPLEIPGSRRWWHARMLPVILSLGGLGYSLARGQANVQVLLFIALSFAALAKGRRFMSGVWLAAAAVVKVIPGFLVLFPLMRRDSRAVAGMIFGAALLLLLVPAAFPTSSRAADWGWKVIALVLKPGVGQGGDQTRAEELTNTTATDSQSFAAIIHNWRHPDRDVRPKTASPETKLAHWTIGAFLTLLTVTLGLPRANGPPADSLVVLGCLNVIMLLLTPVSHMHYYALAYPLVAGLWLKGMAERPGALTPDSRTMAVLISWCVLTSAPLLPGELCERLREGGLAVVATLGLWAYGLATLRIPGNRTCSPAE